MCELSMKANKHNFNPKNFVDKLTFKKSMAKVM